MAIAFFYTKWCRSPPLSFSPLLKLTYTDIGTLMQRQLVEYMDRALVLMGLEVRAVTIFSHPYYANVLIFLIKNVFFFLGPIFVTLIKTLFSSQ